MSLLLVLSLLPVSMNAQEQVDDNTFSGMISLWAGMLELPERLLAEPGFVANQMAPLRENVLVVQRLASAELERARKELERQQILLAALGPPPVDGEAAETAEIAGERTAFTQQVARLDGRVKKCNLILARAKAIIDRMGELELGLMAQILGKRTQNVFSTATLAKAMDEIPIRLTTLRTTFGKWWRETRFDAGWSAIAEAAATAAVGFILIIIIRIWLTARFGRDAHLEAPSLTRRITAIVVETLTRVLLPTIVISGIAYVILTHTPVSRELRFIFYALALSVISFVVISGLAKTALAARRPQWRIADFTDSAAAGLDRAIILFASTLLAVNMVLILLSPAERSRGAVRLVDFEAASNLGLLIGFIGLVVMAGVTLNVLRKENWRFKTAGGEESTLQYEPAPPRIRFVFSAAKIGLIIGVGFGVLGYLNLGTYITGRIIATLALLCAAILIHGLVRTSLRQATSIENTVGARVRQRLGLDDASANRWTFWLVFLIDVFLIIASGSILLILWGVPWSELKPIYSGLIYGMDIGGYRFSLVSIGIALGVFALLLLAIRLFQRFLAKRILVQTRLDVGVRDAVTSGVGYAGIVVAALVGISLMGFQFSEIALIFGALSVGIGFGLQHVVNNFISGLVLLIQRPIKAGDWVVVGTNQGYVRRVNVISTEIQTFDNATLIVPNSNLMTTEVLNWMHRGRLGRVVIPVGVAYSSDPEQVERILLQCAKDDEGILARPAPQVVFQAFGTSSLDFELRFFIREVDEMIIVASRQRFAIKKAFDQAGIEIPFPQTDLHIREMPENT